MRTTPFAGLLVLAALAASTGCSRAGETQATAASASAASASVSAPAAKVITDVAHWQHPTKAVFAKYGVTLSKVVVQDKFATFSVEFPFDPQTGPNARKLEALCLDLLKANGSWSYALVSAQDGIEIDVSWDKQAQRISIENHAL